MATVEITQRALADLERLFDFLAAENPQKAREQILYSDGPLKRVDASSSSRAAATDISRSTVGFRPKT